MDSKATSKKDYFLSKNHNKLPYGFHIYWNPTPFQRIYLGKAWCSFKDTNQRTPDGLYQLALKDWSFEFEETTPGFIKEKIIVESQKCGLNIMIKDVQLVAYEDIYDIAFRKICPPHDDDDRGMKDFYNHVYSRIEDPEVKKLALEILKEWSQPGYCLSMQCQYILKEIEEKERKS